MKIGFLGCGSWGFALARLLAEKGYDVLAWNHHTSLIEYLNLHQEHPRYPGVKIPAALHFTSNIQETIQDVDYVVESVTASGLRPVLVAIKDDLSEKIPLILTSKGLELDSGKTLGEVTIEVLGEEKRQHVASLSGPSFAQEVIQGIPTSVVAAAYNSELARLTALLFSTSTFRVYPNQDFKGVSFGGAMKNIIAIACGIADGLHYGHSTMAALMTRGLHEITKLAIAEGCQQQTLMGLSGMGDLCLTCSSPMSRNYRFGQLLASGLDAAQAKETIGMVVEGSYTCFAALHLSNKHAIPLPLTEMVCCIIEGMTTPKEAVLQLMERAIKEEHL